MNMILNKKHIILAALVLALGVAVYLNFVFAERDGLVEGEDMVTDKNYGDAEFVDEDEEADAAADEVQSVAAGSSFEEARLSRTRARDEAIETLKQIFTDLNAEDAQGGEEAAQAAMEAVGLARSIESESKIENLILAKGFEECLVYISEDSAEVAIKSEGLLANEVSVIKDLILQETNLTAENIKILEVK